MNIEYGNMTLYEYGIHIYSLFLDDYIHAFIYDTI